MNKAESFALSITRLPAGFVATKWPGYFWDMLNEKFYSMKVDGILKEMKHHKSFWPRGRWGELPAGWGISVNGRKRRVTRQEMQKLFPTPSLIPVQR
jgi:hypothetical protein